MQIDEFITQEEIMQFQKHITFKKRKWIEIGCTDHRFFLLEKTKKNKGFISAKKLGTISIIRKRITAKHIIALVLLFIIAIITSFIPYGGAGISVPIWIAVIVYPIILWLISRRQFLFIKIGALKRYYIVKRTNLESVKEAIALVHTYGKKI